MSHLAWTVSDALVMTRRNLTRYVRIPTLVAFSTIQPVMFVLLFAYVFGGAVQVGGKYVDFLMPGVFVQTVVFGSMQTGVGLASDLSLGMVDRFRSLPMARSAVLAGRTLSDTVRNVFVLVLMVTVGTLIGFRFHAGFVPAVAALLVALLFGFAFCWVMAMLGLRVRDAETAQTVGFVSLFPLIFASSVFVPVSSMPGWLQAFARANPVSNAANAVRALSQGGETTEPLLYTLLWIAAILALFMPLATRLYRRSS